MSKTDFFPGVFIGVIFTLIMCCFLQSDFSLPSGPGDSQTIYPNDSDGPALNKSSSPPPEPVAEVIPTEAPAHYILMDVSAYCICEKCCSKKWADGITASGVPAVGRICAAPPEYAFGTKLFVEGYGEYTVEDRGRVIIGNKLDLLFPTHQAALNFGRKDLLVKVIK